MAAMQEIDPSIRFEIFTHVPCWFFQTSLAGAFGYHALLTDIGLVQKTSLLADLPATLQRLDDFLPFERCTIADLAGQLHTLECALVMCDIAPMGIAVAKEAGIPSILIENFTWDWIYQEYTAGSNGIVKYINYLQALFTTADYHIQTEPVCVPRSADLTTQPVSRKCTTSAVEIRTQLAIPHEAHVVLLTMGGIPAQYTFLPQLAEQQGIFFVVPGGSSSVQTRGNILLLPQQTPVFHPDLVNACDAVVGKAGYSTVAEVYHAGIPFGYIARQDFRESPVLVTYMAQHMQGIAIPETSFHHGNWLARLPELLALPRQHRSGPNGADQAARFTYQLLHGPDVLTGTTSR